MIWRKKLFHDSLTSGEIWLIKSTVDLRDVLVLAGHQDSPTKAQKQNGSYPHEGHPVGILAEKHDTPHFPVLTSVKMRADP